MGRRRREVQLAAGHRPPAASRPGCSTPPSWCPAAVLAGVVGWVAARGVVAVTVGSSTPTRSVLRIGGPVERRRGVRRPRGLAPWWPRRRTGWRPGASRAARRCALPWVLVLVVVAASATVGLLTRPPAAGDTLGPARPARAARWSSPRSPPWARGSSFAVLRRARHGHPGRPPGARS